MPIILKIILFVVLLPFGAGIIYRLVDMIYAGAVEFRSATGKDVCLLVATFLVLVYCGILVWYFFIK